MVGKGDAIVVVAGVKVPKGTTGKVFWVGDTKYGVRVGFKDGAGTTHWTAMSNVAAASAPAPVAEPSAAPSLEAKVNALLVLVEVMAKNAEALEAKVNALSVMLDAENEAKSEVPAPFIPDGVDPFDVHAFSH
jgi:hypothetical protein